MDLRKLLGTLDSLTEGTMASAKKKDTGPKFVGKMKGTDPASAAKDKYVGSSMEESIFKELEATLKKDPEKRDLMKEFREFKEQASKQDAWAAGYQAFHDDVTKCPYAPGSEEANQWNLGWESAQARGWGNEGVAEAKAATAAFRSGNDKRAALNAMSDAERRAYDKEQQEKQRKRDDARLERERQKLAAKKSVTESSDIERKIHRTQQLIQDYYNRSRVTKNDIKRDHYIDMARQLEYDLEGMINDANQAEQDGYDVAQHDAEPSATWNRGGLNEFAPGNGGDDDNYAEYVVYQCDPNDQFEFIGGPLYQTDSMGMAHKYAYEHYLRYRPKAFVVYQPHKEASRGNYGVKGESDGNDLHEGFSELELAVMEGGHELVNEAPVAPVAGQPAQPLTPAGKPQLGTNVANPQQQVQQQTQQAKQQADAAKQAQLQQQQLQKGVNSLKSAGAAVSNAGQTAQAFNKVNANTALSPTDKTNIASAGTALAPIMSNPQLAGKFKDLVSQAGAEQKKQQQQAQQQAQAPQAPQPATGAQQ